MDFLGFLREDGADKGHFSSQQTEDELQPGRRWSEEPPGRARVLPGLRPGREDGKEVLIPLKGEKIPCNSFQSIGSPWPLAGDSFSPSEKQNECKSSSDTSSQVGLLLI